LKRPDNWYLIEDIHWIEKAFIRFCWIFRIPFAIKAQTSLNRQAIVLDIYKLGKHHKINNFTKQVPTQGEWFAFICPEEIDRWAIGWMDWYDIRIEGGGGNYKKEELSYWIPLPHIENTKRGVEFKYERQRGGN
jgi:hypothetical protein